LILITNGFTKCAFSAYDVRFQDALQSIKGPQEDFRLLQFLTAVFCSPLASYFHFHTSSSWAIERPKVSLDELLHTPFFLPDSPFAQPDAQAIVDKVGDIMDELQQTLLDAPVLCDREGIVDEAKRRTNELVYRYFDLTTEELTLIEDTITVVEKSATPTSFHSPSLVSLQYPNLATRKAYVDLLCETLNAFSRDDAPKVSAFSYVANDQGLILLTVVRGSDAKPYYELEDSETVEKELARIESFCLDQGHRISYRQGFCLVERDRIHLLKPAALRHWMKSTALNDADEIYYHIVGGKHVWICGERGRMGNAVSRLFNPRHVGPDV
jgi:hypothetical protein